MATLSGNKIKDTYQSLIKLTDNGNLTTGAKQLTDGFGNNSPLYISTTQIGIGVTPEATYDLHVYSNAKVGGNLTVTGDLTVEGTTTTIDTQTLTVEDPLIEVASNNTSTDAVDIGWYGKYAPSGTVLYAGLFRDTGDSKFKLFRNLEEQPTTTVNTSGTGYTKAGLVIGNLEATQVDLGDNEKIRFGASQDIEIYYDGTTDRAYFNSTSASQSIFAGGSQSIIRVGGTQNALVANHNGNVSLNYSGATKISTSSTGVTVEGIVASDGLDVGDSEKIRLGDSQDLEIYHNGTSASIRNNTGDILISALEADSNIKFYTDNGVGTTVSNLEISGSTGTVSLKYYGSQKLYTTNTGISVTGRISQLTDPSAAQDAATKAYVDAQIGANNELSEVLSNGNTTGGTDIEVSAGDNIDFADGSSARFGAGLDLKIQHNGTNSLIDNEVGDFYIRQEANDQDLIFQADDGSGGNATYFELDGSSQINKFYQHTRTIDNKYLGAGSSLDMYMFHDGTNSFIRNGTGNLTIEQQVDDGDLIFKSDNGSGGVTTYMFLDGSAVNTRFFKDAKFSDNVKAIFGGSNDLEIYHDGSNSYISDTGTGNLFITGASNIYLQNGSNETYLDTTTNGAVRLYHDNSLKFETTSTGVNVTGGINTSGDFINVGNGQGNSENYLQLGHSRTGNGYAYVDFVGDTTYSDFGLRIIRGNSGANATSTIEHRGTGNFDIKTTEAANLRLQTANTTAITIDSSRQIQFNEYGSGTFTGTATYRLAVDSSGDVIEIPIGDGAVDGSGTANYVTKWSDTDTITNSVIYDNGTNVGIGTTTIGARLEVAASATTSVDIAHFSNSNSVQKAIFKLSGVGAGQLVLRDAGNNEDVLISSDGDSFFNGGSVGIGTSSPNQKLDVVGRVRASYDTSNYYEIGATSNGGFVIGKSSGVETVNIRTYGDSYFTGGNFGIGTSSLDHKLEVYQNADNKYVATFEQDHATGWGVLIDVDSTTNNDPALWVKNATTTAIWAGSGGSVGIGTTSPAYKLQVSGAQNANDIVINNTTTGVNLRLQMIDGYGFMFTTGSKDLLLGTNNTERMRIDSSGVVQVRNSSSPTLQIYNTDTFVAVGQTLGKLDFYSTDGAKVSSYIEAEYSSAQGDSELIFATSVSAGSATERMRIDSSGSVGIGTDSPEGNLHVKINDSGATPISQQHLILENNSATGIGILTSSSTTGYIFFGDESDAQRGYISYNHPNDRLTFKTGGSERVFIDSSGRVGINETSLTEKLEVNGAIVWKGALTTSKTSAGVLDRSGNDLRIRAYGATSGTGNLVFRTGGGGGSVDSEAMRITSGGNVGIGETSPDSKLHVKGDFITIEDPSGGFKMELSADTDPVTIMSDNLTGAAYGQIAFVAGNGSGSNDQERMRINSSGNVGIGTDSPSHLLHIKKPSSGDAGLMIETVTGGDPTLYFNSAAANRSGLIRFQDNGTTIGRIEYVHNGDRLAFQAGSATGETMSIINDAVGIGTTSPSYKLDVEGSDDVLGSFESTDNKTAIRIKDNDTYTYVSAENGLSTIGNHLGANANNLNLNSSQMFFGTTSPQGKFTVDAGTSSNYAGHFVYDGTSGSYGVLRLRMSSTSPSFIDFIYDGYSTTNPVGAIVTGGTNVLYQSYSDYRLKENVADLTGALDRVNNLQPKTFNYINAPETTNEGFIAHELQEVVPQAVSGEKDGMNQDGTPKYQGVDNAHIVPLLVGAIKELKAEIETLKAQINN